MAQTTAPDAKTKNPSSSPVAVRSLDTDVQYVKGVGPRLAGTLNKLGVFTVRDLLGHYPRRHEDRTRFARVAGLQHGESATILGTVLAADNVKARSLILTKVAVDDGTGAVTLTWFNQKWLKDKFLKLIGRKIIAYGTVQMGRWGFEIASPEWELFDENADPLSSGRVVPVYPLTEGLFENQLRKIIKNALDIFLPVLDEILPEDLRDRLDLMNIRDAVRNIHFPESVTAMEAARKRLVFEELFVLQLAIAIRKHGMDAPGVGISFAMPANFARELRQILPFELTNAQKRVIREIARGHGPAAMHEPPAAGRRRVGQDGRRARRDADSRRERLPGRDDGADRDSGRAALFRHHERCSGRWACWTSVDCSPAACGRSSGRRMASASRPGATQMVIGTHALIQEGVEFA